MDILHDLRCRLAERLIARLGLADEVADLLGLVIDEVRADWAGERPYIAKSTEAARASMGARNRSIIREFKAGERVPYLARKYGISRQRVWDIIKG